MEDIAREESYVSGSSSGVKYVKLTSKKAFGEWKRKTLAMARQQGLKEFLESEVQVDTKEQLEAKQEAYETAPEQDEKRLKYEYVKAKRKVHS